MDFAFLLIGRKSRSPGRTEVVVAVARNQMDMIVKDILPSRFAVGLGDIQAAQIQPVAQQASDSMDGPHHRLSFLFRKCPDVYGMSPRNHECVATGCVPLVEEGDRVLILVHTPRWQRALDDLAEDAFHGTILPLC